MQDDLIERWGFEWKGHDHGTHVRMADGYWAPWHIAADRIEALEAENMMLREERDRLIKFVNIMCEEYGLEYDGVVKQ
jgi:hypothetical protein